MLEELIAQHRASIDGELSDRNRVIDLLLDLRLAAADHPDVVERIDRFLVDVPGVTTVTNAWWGAVLSDIDMARRAVPSA